MADTAAMRDTVKPAPAALGKKIRPHGPFFIAAILALLLGQAGCRTAMAPASAPTATPNPIPANALYVDGQLAAEAVENYDPQTRLAGHGSARAFKTIRAAVEAAQPSQTVVFRGGTFEEPLVAARSGEPGRPITFLAFPGEAPLITGLSLHPAVDFSGRSYLVLDGLAVDNVNRWLYAGEASHLIIRGCRFTRSVNPTGSSMAGVFFEQASFNQIVGNTLDDCSSDSFGLVRSDHNLVEGNTFRKAGHTLWTVKGSNFNILRGNYFHNEIQKIGEVYDSERGTRNGINHDSDPLNSTKHNVIEANVFAHTASSGNKAWFAGIQYAGQKGIIRRNVFYDTIGPGLHLTLYPREAKYNTDNRVYNNVFDRTGIAGIALAGGPGPGYEFYGNVLKNNILAHSIFVANDTRWPWYVDVLSGKPVQLFVGQAGGFVFENNDLFGSKAGEVGLIVVGSRDAHAHEPLHDLAWWQNKDPEVFKSNLELDPGFVDEEHHDFHLKPGSPMIDAGAFLTEAAADGKSDCVPVKDASWFCDGFGIPGQAGDLIQLEGQSEPARVLAVDYDKNELHLDRRLSFKAGQGVATAYCGKRPDLGAFEYQGKR